VRLYEGSVGAFRDDVVHNVLADKLASAFEGYYRRRAPKGEVGAWQQSLNYLKNSFEIAELDEQRVIVEYELPYSSRRIDVLLFGRGAAGEDGIVLIELKQWSNDTVADAEAEGNVRVRFQQGMKEVAHPSWQVEGYHYDLQDFLQNSGSEPKTKNQEDSGSDPNATTTRGSKSRRFCSPGSSAPAWRSSRYSPRRTSRRSASTCRRGSRPGRGSRCSTGSSAAPSGRRRSCSSTPGT
jgi:hypothetical protein